jgi:toxin-antitoxin system PIN domain toxin
VTDLLDVNLLISLAWPNHVHHPAARAWFAARSGRPWATTPVTEAGFVRVSANPSAIPTAVTPGEATALLGRIRDVEGHMFLPDDIELVTGSERALAGRLVGHRQVTDAHLLALARRHGARLATLDHAITTMAGQNARDVILVPVLP